MLRCVIQSSRKGAYIYVGTHHQQQRSKRIDAAATSNLTILVKSVVQLILSRAYIICAALSLPHPEIYIIYIVHRRYITAHLSLARTTVRCKSWCRCLTSKSRQCWKWAKLRRETLYNIYIYAFPRSHTQPKTRWGEEANNRNRHGARSAQGPKLMSKVSQAG